LDAASIGSSWSRATRYDEHEISAASNPGFAKSAAAFRRSLRRQTDAGVRLRTEQAEWLKRRDTCERDKACLSRTMRERIDELMQD
jgi:hypothetical protein